MADVTATLRDRLQTAALELFAERGYESTTAAQIAARAGVTERTFFRQFADKREVLFGGEAIVRTALTEAIVQAPAELGPLAALFQAFHAFEAVQLAGLGYLQVRQRVISATPALRERELAKFASLADALACALRARGVPAARASLAAQVGMSAFIHATLAWLEDPAVGFGERLTGEFSELKALLSAGD